MITLLIIGGITTLAAIAANKSSAHAPSGPSATPATSATAASGMDGIFHSPESQALYSAAQKAVTYNSPARATIPIQPASPRIGISALPPTLQRVLGVKSATVASAPVVSASSPVRAISVSRPQRQRFTLL